MKARSEASLIGIVVYDGVEPIDIGGTVGVISMATRLLPALKYVVIAERKGPVRLASGLTILADSDFTGAPDCDIYIVTGGLILAASGRLAGRTATTRRNAVGSETEAPLDLLNKGGHLHATKAAALVDDRGTVTSGGVSLAIDGTLYVLGRLYGEEICQEVASIIEYDRAYAANREALGHVRLDEARSC